MANDDACKIRIFESLRGQMESSDFRQTVLIPTLITGPKKALSPPPHPPLPLPPILPATITH